MNSPLVSCCWTEDFAGNWSAQCGEQFVLVEGSPHDNKMMFCCYCGGRLVENKYFEPKESE